MGKRKVKRTQGRQPKHGSRMLMRLLRQNRLDKRTGAWKALRAVAEELASDRGGWGHCTAAERLLIEHASAIALVLSYLEHWLFKQQVIGADGEMTFAARRGMLGYANTLRSNLALLGLRPDVASRLPSLSEYLRETEVDPAPEAPGTAVATEDAEEPAS